jgi:Abortive infection C-terminus
VTKNIKLSDRTLKALAFIISGGSSSSSSQDMLGPYRSGPDILLFFNRLRGTKESYSSSGFGSRVTATLTRLEAINNSALVKQAIEAAVHPADYIDCGRDAEGAVAHLNGLLKFEGLELQKYGLNYRLAETGGTSVTVSHSSTLDSDYLREQIEKAEQKLGMGDYEGAITNARTLVEGLLLDIERAVTSAEPSQDGDLLKYYKRVQKLLNLDPTQTTKSGKAIPESLQMVLRGLGSVVHGIAEARNKMGDAHAREFKPDKRHAALVVNSAKTIADFLFETYEHQKVKGTIRSASASDTK